MIEVYSTTFDKVKKFDNGYLDMLDETESKYFEFFSSDNPIGFFRLRHKNTITNLGNSFIYENNRGMGWGSTILLVGLNVIKKVFPKTTILYAQVHVDNTRMINIRDEQFGTENKYFETEEPNRFGFMERAREVDKDYKELLWYDLIDNVWERNKEDINKIEVKLK
jgi:hypothetical protein